MEFLLFIPYLVLFNVIARPSACLSSIVETSFTILRNIQLPSPCFSLNGSTLKISRLTCAVHCAHTSVCEGFNIRCLDVGRPTVFCQCEICTSINLGGLLPVNGTIAGVARSQTKDGLSTGGVLDAGTLATTSPAAFAVSETDSTKTTSLGESGTTEAQGQSDTTVAKLLTTLMPPCGPPPLIARTIVKYTWTAQQTTATYRCSVSTDVYVRGTTDVYCTSGYNWPWATILCAPTTCFHNRHDIWGPVYAGTVNTGCQFWSVNWPRHIGDLYTLDRAYRSDNDNRVRAVNYCRIFDDGNNFTWCYNSNFMASNSVIECNVPACPVVAGQLDPASDSPGLTSTVPPCGYPPLIARTTVNFTATSDRAVATYRCRVTSDKYIRGTTEVTCTVGSAWPRATILCAPTMCYHNRHDVWGPVYAGTAMASGAGCQAWTTDSPWTKEALYKLDLAYRSDNDNKANAANYCRIFDDGILFTWCYVNTLFALPNWVECTVPACPDVPGQLEP